MLIKCPECGKELSDKASSCPNCGCPIEAIKSVYEDADPSYNEELVERMRKYAYLTEQKMHLISSMNKNIVGREYSTKLDKTKLPNPIKVGAIIGGILTLIGLIPNIIRYGFLGIWIYAGVVTFIFFAGIPAIIVHSMNNGKRKKLAQGEKYLKEADRFHKVQAELEHVSINEIPEKYRYVYALRAVSSILDENKMMSVEGAISQYEMQTKENERKENEKKQIELLEKQNQILVLQAQISALHAKSTAQRNKYDALKDLL